MEENSTVEEDTIPSNGKSRAAAVVARRRKNWAHMPRISRAERIAEHQEKHAIPEK